MGPGDWNPQDLGLGDPPSILTRLKTPEGSADTGVKGFLMDFFHRNFILRGLTADAAALFNASRDNRLGAFWEILGVSWPPVELCT